MVRRSFLSYVPPNVHHSILTCKFTLDTAGVCPVGGGSGGSSTPPKVWHNSQLSSCVITIVTDKQQLVANTNNKLTGLALNGSFSSLLGLKQPSLSSSYLQERVNEGRGQRLGGVAKHFARV